MSQEITKKYLPEGKGYWQIRRVDCDFVAWFWKSGFGVALENKYNRDTQLHDALYQAAKSNKPVHDFVFFGGVPKERKGSALENRI